jgi:PPOX class probable F420-dependent enzyme
MADVLPDEGTEFGARVRRRLRDDKVIWLTTVGADGTPQPNPVWFLDEGGTVLVYNQPTARRLVHIADRPRVGLNFDGDGRGGDVIVLTGHAEIVDDQPLADAVPAYMEKYRAAAEQVSGDSAAFASSYSVAIRITLDRVRGF